MTFDTLLNIIYIGKLYITIIILIYISDSLQTSNIKKKNQT